MARPKKLDVGMKCITRMLFISNTIFLMIGVLLTAIGSTIHAVYSEFELFIQKDYFKPVEFCISVGVVMIAISVVGYIGTAKKSTLLINTYALLLFLLLTFEGSTAIIGFVMSSTIFTNIKINMVDALNNYNGSPYIRNSWAAIQERLHCCGVYHPFNWASRDVLGPEVTLGNYTFTVPESCCRDLRCNAIYKEGCLDVLGKYASDSTITITCCATIVIFAEIAGAIFACMLGKSLRRAKTNEEMKRQQNLQRIFEQLNGGQEKTITPVFNTSNSSDA